MRPKASGAGLVCRTDHYFQRQNYVHVQDKNREISPLGERKVTGKGSGEKVSFKTIMEDPVRHANHRFRSRVGAFMRQLAYKSRD